MNLPSTRPVPVAPALSETTRNILAILAWVLIATVVAAVLTVATAAYDRAECQDNGGTFYLTSTVWGCNY